SYTEPLSSVLQLCPERANLVRARAASAGQVDLEQPLEQHRLRLGAAAERDAQMRSACVKMPPRQSGDAVVARETMARLVLVAVDLGPDERAGFRKLSMQTGGVRREIGRAHV